MASINKNITSNKQAVVNQGSSIQSEQKLNSKLNAQKTETIRKRTADPSEEYVTR